MEWRFLLACRQGKLNEVKQLLQNTSINVNVRDEWGVHFTALMYACENGNFEVVQLLIKDERTSLNLVDDFGRSAFYWACTYGRVEIVKFMLTLNELDINQQDRYGKTPFMKSCYYGHLEIVEMFLVCGRPININHKMTNGRTAIVLTREGRASDEKKCWETVESFNKRKENYLEIERLIDSFKLNPKETRFILRIRLGFTSNFFFFQIFFFFQFHNRK